MPSWGDICAHRAGVRAAGSVEGIPRDESELWTGGGGEACQNDAPKE